MMSSPDELASTGHAPDSNITPLPDYSAAAADRKMIVIPLIAVSIAGVIAMVICTALAGGKGLLAATIGTVVVLAFFGGGMAVVARVLRNNPAIAMGVALLTFVVQILFLFILLILLREATFFAPRAFAATILGCTLVWTFAAILVLARTKVLVVEPGSGPPGHLPTS